jgi:CRP/FNR family transcriptional regulator, cyclic AMP receptor protein
MKTILIIEDDDIMLENTAEILTLSRYHVLKANSSEMGMELAMNNSPDLIICDVPDTGNDEIAIVKKLQSSGATNKIPLIFLTPLIGQTSARSAFINRNYCISKPYQGDELLRLVERTLHS